MFKFYFSTQQLKVCKATVIFTPNGTKKEYQPVFINGKQYTECINTKINDRGSFWPDAKLIAMSQNCRNITVGQP